jgi:ADP-heptose:LPS heptosyltransferase
MKIKNILIIPRPHLGDFIWATSAVALIKQTFLQSEITVIIPENLIELVDNNPIFDEYYSYNLSLFESKNILKKLFYRIFLFIRLSLLLRRKVFDICFMFSPFKLFIKLPIFLKIRTIAYSMYECCGNNIISVEHSILKKFIPKSKLFPVKVEGNLDRIHRSEIYQSVVRSYIQSGNISLPSIPVLKNGFSKIDNLLKTEKLHKIAICMQPSKASKNIWPERYFAETILVISSSCQSAFFIIGSKEKNDKHFNSLKEKLPPEIEMHNLYGKTSILELREFLSGCDLLISVDTGTIHVAAVTKINIITLFGMTHPDAVMPMSHKNISFYAGAECSPCVYKLAFEKKKCPYGDKPKCMEMIKPEEVITAAIEILSGAESRGKVRRFIISQ